MDNQKILFRCSELAKIMTRPRLSVRRGVIRSAGNTKKSNARLSQTCKTYLLDVVCRYYFGREKDIENYYVTKGMMVEDDAITLYSRHRGVFIEKNEHIYRNDYLAGCPDAVTDRAVIEFKSSWDLPLHLERVIHMVNRDAVIQFARSYYWQAQGYMALAGKERCALVYCLVNTPVTIVNDMKRRLLWRMNVSDSDELYSEAAAKIDAASVFDDLPMRLRVAEFEIIRSDDDIQAIYERIEVCRDYIKKIVNAIL